MKLTFSKYLCFCFALLALAGCKDDEQANDSTNAPLAALRLDIAAHTADNMIPTAYARLATDVNTLEQSVLDFENVNSLATLQALRAAHFTAWTAWQYASLYQFGPAEENALRQVTNTYPTDADKINQNISEKTVVLNNLSNFDAIGFPAIDYLINDLEDQAIMDRFSNSTDQIVYLKAIVSLMKATIMTVHNDFTSGDFVENFKSENSNGIDVGSALGIMVNSMDFHFQRDVRDAKVAIPAGIRSAGVVRPTNVEARYSGQSRSLLITSLEAYKDLFNGVDATDNSGASIMDYLVAIDQEAIATDLDTKINEAITLASSLNENLADQIEADNEQMITLFLELQEIVTLIKSDMVSLMGITLTNQDNDGD